MSKAEYEKSATKPRSSQRKGSSKNSSSNPAGHYYRRPTGQPLPQGTFDRERASSPTSWISEVIQHDPQAEFHQRDRDIHPPASTPVYKTSALRSPRIPLWSLQNSLSEVTGPGFHRKSSGRSTTTSSSTMPRQGEPIGEQTIVHGHVLDDNGRRRPGALVEIWQANAGGRHRHATTPTCAARSNFGGSGRTLTDDVAITASAPSSPALSLRRNRVNSWRPAHIHLSVFGAGFAQRLITQMYFEGDPLIWQMRSSRPSRTGGDRAADRAARPERDAAARRASPTASTSSCAAAARRCSKTSCRGTDMSAAPLSQGNALADGRPLRAYRPDPQQAGFDIFEKISATTSSAPTPGERIAIEGRVLDGAGTPCAMRWSKSGRPMRPAATTIPRTGRTGASIRSLPRLGPGRHRFREGIYRSRPSSPAASRAAAAASHGAACQPLARRPRHQYRPHTRIYFCRRERPTPQDPVLNIIEQQDRRETLIAPRRG